MDSGIPTRGSRESQEELWVASKRVKKSSFELVFFSVFVGFYAS